MKTTKRLEKIEQQVPCKEEPQFISWIGHPWTEQEKAEALRKDPRGTFFWKTLSSTLTVEDFARRKAAGESLVNENPQYVAF